MGGDFNMIESPHIQSGGSRITVHGFELATWERLCMCLWIEDVWQHEDFGCESGSLDFS